MLKFITGIIAGITIAMMLGHETIHPHEVMPSATGINDATYERAKRQCEGSMGGLDKLEIHVIPNGNPPIAVVARCMSGNIRYTQ